MLALGAVIAGVVLAPGASAPAGPPTGLRVTVLDVGQGDAVLLQEPGRAVLVDAGPPQGGVVGRLRDAGVDRLDALVVTHASSDHEGGAPAVLRELEVGLLVDGRRVSGREPDELARAPGRRSTRPPPPQPRRESGASSPPRARPCAREVWPCGSGGRRPCQPAPWSPPVADHNERATVLELEAWGARVLLPADAESDVLSRLDLAAVDVLKVSHHGSADDGLAGVLARVRPQVAVIPVGRGNRYGHPARSTLRTLREVPVVLRTDRDGTVRLDLDDGRWAVRTERGQERGGGRGVGAPA
jgi:competence protein ComEC